MWKRGKVGGWEGEGEGKVMDERRRKWESRGKDEGGEKGVVGSSWEREKKSDDAAGGGGSSVEGR